MMRIYLTWKPLNIHSFNDFKNKSSHFIIRTYKDFGTYGCTSTIDNLWSVIYSRLLNFIVNKLPLITHSNYKCHRFSKRDNQCLSWSM